MAEAGSSLPAAVQRAAYARIATWRQAPDAPMSCPRCDAMGATLTDRSARPFAEWFEITCTACGLNHTFNVPVSRAGSD